MLDTKEVEKFLIGYFTANQLLGKSVTYLQFYNEIHYRIKGIDRVHFKYDSHSIKIIIEILENEDGDNTEEAKEIRKKIRSLKLINNHIEFENNFSHVETYQMKIYNIETFKEVINEIL